AAQGEGVGHSKAPEGLGELTAKQTVGPTDCRVPLPQRP
ncbi:PTF1A isoform 3, partial [Pongo abelii]